MLNTANLFIFAYTQQEEALRWLTCNCDLPGTKEDLEKFQKEFRGHFSEALKVREECSSQYERPYKGKEWPLLSLTRSSMTC